MGGLSEFLQGLIGSAGLPNSGHQLLIIAFALFAVLLIAFSLGKSKTMLVLLSLYISSFIASRFDFIESFQASAFDDGLEGRVFIIRLIIFVLIFSGVVFILSRSFLRNKLTIRESSIFAVLLTAVVSVGFLFSVFTSYLPADQSFIPPFIMLLFGSSVSQLIWAVLPIACMFILKRERY